jgi:hypothetical protein
VSSNSVSLTWSAGDDGGAAITDYVVEYSANGIDWTTHNDGESVATSVTVSGLSNATTYMFRVSAVNSEGQGPASSVLTRTTLAAPSSLTITSKTSSSVSLSWTAPAAPVTVPISDYVIDYSTDGLSWTRFIDSQTSATSVVVTGLDEDSKYDFRIAAKNTDGTGPTTRLVGGTALSEFILIQTPQAPDPPSLGERTNTSLSFSWDRPSEDGMQVTNFVLRHSTDNGKTWSNQISIGNTTSWTYSGLSVATARLVQIAAIYGMSQSRWSEPVLATTKGTKITRVTVTDSSGNPITGGAITWQMSDGSIRSSKAYGLTSNGVIDFPAAPAGFAEVTVTNGVLSSGITVSGTWTTTLGFDQVNLATPDIGITSREVFVRVPNGPPVPDVVVSLTSGILSARKTIGAFSFQSTKSSNSQITDNLGRVTFSGFISGAPKVRVDYDDGVLAQTQTDIDIIGATTNVELEYLPYSVVGDQILTVDVGTSVAVTVTLKAPAAASLALLRGPLNLLQAGIPVSLVLPPGVPKGNCGSQLSASTNILGKATFKVCATKTGIYGLKANGLILDGSVTVRVRKTVPTEPTSLSAISRSVGAAQVTWKAPFYNGNVPITGYTVILSAPGQINRTLTTSRLAATFSGLSNATRYKVSIFAENKFGKSNVITTYVSVA